MVAPSIAVPMRTICPGGAPARRWRPPVQRARDRPRRTPDGGRLPSDLGCDQAVAGVLCVFSGSSVAALVRTGPPGKRMKREAFSESARTIGEYVMRHKPCLDGPHRSSYRRNGTVQIHKGRLRNRIHDGAVSARVRAPIRVSGTPPALLRALEARFALRRQSVSAHVRPFAVINRRARRELRPTARWEACGAKPKRRAANDARVRAAHRCTHTLPAALAPPSLGTSSAHAEHAIKQISLHPPCTAFRASSPHTYLPRSGRCPRLDTRKPPWRPRRDQEIRYGSSQLRHSCLISG